MLRASPIRRRPDFLALPSALSRVAGELRYFAFYILHLEGKDLRALPLEERHRRLAAVIADAGQPWLVPVGTFPDGARLLSSCEQMGIEGVVSKKRAAPYRSGGAGSRSSAKPGALRIRTAARSFSPAYEPGVESFGEQF